ncbi:hypothetical protein [Cupriavidus sp. UYPR2.512]|uniref:hypothetical protein n=1 Tax=Cupriavidus sp. UYPR2.512 TaxID=1080187 RepID=UPI000364BD07|nr:hypothetical protein [Cupriavidus sp. UYPR2.512]UIF89181.1 hypothetical protein KAF44_29775 [Cupriavidus necator]
MNVELTAQKWAAATQIIASNAIEFMARREGLTIDQVQQLIDSRHEGAIRQFKQLIKLGVDEACRLHDAGQICLIAA